MSPAPADTTKLGPSASDERSLSTDDANLDKDHNAVSTSEGIGPTADTPVAEESAAKGETEMKDTGSLRSDDVSDDAHNSADETSHGEGTPDAPPLPEEAVPPLPEEALPVEDDGWTPVWEETAQAFYFYNRFTGATQWTNPRVPEASQLPAVAPGMPLPAIQEDSLAAPRPAAGYDPAIHGDYDPTAWYAQTQPSTDVTDPSISSSNSTDQYTATGTFNRFTGRWQAAELGPENHNDENKSKRQMNAYFDVDAAANSHDGRSLKAERSGKKLSKTELKQFKEKRKAKKEEKRRAWLRD